MARKSKAAQKRSEAARKGWETRLANKRSAAARKGWETRRAAKAPPPGTQPPPAPPPRSAPPPSRGGAPPQRYVIAPERMREIENEWDDFDRDEDWDPFPDESS